MVRRSFIQKCGVASIAIPFFPSFVNLGATSREVQVGLIGIGQRGQQLLAVLRQLPGVKVRHLSDPNDRALARTIASMPGGEGKHSPFATNDYAQLLHQKDLDAVIVATPSPMLPIISRQACEAGKYVYSETPDPADRETTSQLQDYTQKYGRQLQVGWQRRSAPTLAAAAQEVHQGRIGTIQQVSVVHTYSPEVTNRETLLHLAQQDLDLSGYLAKANLLTKSDFFTGSSLGNGYTSIGTQFQADDVEVTWQGLARSGGKPTPPSRTIRIYGSKGVLQTASDGLNYQLVDYAGRVVQQKAGEPLSDEELTRLHLLHFLRTVRS